MAAKKTYPRHFLFIGIAITVLLVIGIKFALLQQHSLSQNGSITLFQNTPTLLPGTSIQLTAENIHVEKRTPCYDCMTSATLLVQHENTTEKVLFRIGGIAGFRQKTGKASGYRFTLKNIAPERLDIDYTKE